MTVKPWQKPMTGQAAVAVDRICASLPRIARGRIILRAPYLDDYPLFESIVTGERGRWIGGPLTSETAWLDFIQMVAGWVLRGAGLWTVELQATGERVGFVVLNHETGDPEMELGFLFPADNEGKGYAFEAGEAARNNAFFALNRDTLISWIDPENARAIKLVERLGAQRDPASDIDGSLAYRYPRPEFEM